MKKEPKFKIDNSGLTRLVVKAQKGNQKAIEEIVDLVSGYIYCYCLSLLGNSENARDAVQDILLIMLNKLDTVENPQAFLGWIKTVTANYCKSRRGRAKTEYDIDGEYEELEDDCPQVSPSKSLETKEVCALVRNAVQELPPHQRECVLMYYFYQLSITQIANTLELNENTVKSRLYSARKSMKKKLELCGAATLASCAVPPLSLLSYSLITSAEDIKLVIPFTSSSGKLMVAVARTAAKSAVSARIAAAACAAVVAVGGIGIAGASYSNNNREKSSAVSVSAENKGTADSTFPTSFEAVESTTEGASPYVPSVTVMPTVQRSYTPTAPPLNTAEPTVQPLNTAVPTAQPTEAIPQTTAAPVIQTPTSPKAAEPTQAPTVAQTTAPLSKQKTVYFDAGKWTDFSKLYCHIYKKNGGSFFDYATKKEACTLVSGTLYSYDLSLLDSKGGLEEGEEYVMIFMTEKGSATNELSFTTAFFERTAYLTGELANPELAPTDSPQKNLCSHVEISIKAP